MLRKKETWAKNRLNNKGAEKRRWRTGQAGIGGRRCGVCGVDAALSHAGVLHGIPLCTQCGRVGGSGTGHFYSDMERTENLSS